MRAIIAEPHDFSEEAIHLLQSFSSVHKENLTDSQLSWALDSFDIFWFRLGFRLDHSHIADAKRCKYILTAVTGLDHIDLQACEEKGIKVISLQGEKEFLSQIRATAEHTMGLTLSLLRKLPDAVMHTREGNFKRHAFKGREIYNKTVGILGMGRLGGICATYFDAFGAHVIGYDPIPFKHPSCRPVASAEELFERSDLVSIHVNLSTETRHIVNNDLLKRMPKGSFLINTSRGQVVDSAALIEALDNDHLCGAACDVIEDEYQPMVDSLLEYAQLNPNKLLLTPHIGGNTFESFHYTEIFLVQKLIEMLKK